jgi:hypothetical protein
MVPCPWQDPKFRQPVELLIRDFGYTRAAERPKDRAKANGHDDPGGTADWAYLKAAIREGRDLHQNTLVLGAKYVAAGMSKPAAVNAVRAEMEISTAPRDQRWQDRWDDVSRSIRDLPDKPNGPDSNQPGNAVLVSSRASTFETRAIEWIWPGRFAFKKLGLLVGLPDEGKGQILCDIIARITRGGEWPCDEGQAPKGNVILLTAEDDIEDTVKPRLLAADADVECVEIVRMVREGKDNKHRMFSLISDLSLLRQKIIEVGNVIAVMIDPISAYLGVKKMDSFRTNDVRAVLAPLVDLAMEMKVGIIGIMHFNKKVDVTNALLRISDSLAFGATARHVYAVVDDVENKRKLLVKAKNNATKRTQKAIAYDFGLKEVGTDPETKEKIWAPHIVWQGHVDVTATEAMQAANESKSPAARDDAKKFLENFRTHQSKRKWYPAR